MSPLNIYIWQNEQKFYDFFVVGWAWWEGGIGIPWSQYSKEKNHPSLTRVRTCALTSLSPAVSVSLSFLKVFYIPFIRKFLPFMSIIAK